MIKIADTDGNTHYVSRAHIAAFTSKEGSDDFTLHLVTGLQIEVTDETAWWIVGPDEGPAA